MGYALALCCGVALGATLAIVGYALLVMAGRGEDDR